MMRCAILAASALFLACPSPSGSDGGTGGGATGGGATGGGATGGGATGGGAAGVGGGGGASAETQFCRDFFNAQIDLIARCNGLAPSAEAAQRAAIDAQCLLSAFTAPSARVNATAAMTCLSTFASETCATSNVYVGGAPATCYSAVEGSVAINGSCFVSECVPGAYCDQTTTCPGTCRARVALGQMPMPGQECVEGAEPYDGVCTALVALGQSCAPTGMSTQQHGCVGFAQCLGAQVCTNPQTRLATAGQTCDEQIGTLCAFGLQCVSNTCRASATIGTSCATVPCQFGLFCNASQTCVALGTAGAACTTDEACGPNLACLNSTCGVLPTTGQPCPAQRCADYRQFCAMDGTCKLRGGVGAMCSQLNDCQSNHYCTTAGTCARRKNAGETCAMTPPGTSTDECLGSSCPQGTCVGQGFCSP